MQTFPAAGLKGPSLVKGRVDLEEGKVRFDRFQGLIQPPQSGENSGLGIQKRYQALPADGLLNPGDEGRRVLRVIAVFSYQPRRLVPCFQVHRQKNMIAARSQIGHMAMEGRDGGAELGAGQGLSPVDGIPAGLARPGLQRQQVKELFPERQVFEEMKGRRKPDGRRRCRWFPV